MYMYVLFHYNYEHLGADIFIAWFSELPVYLVSLALTCHLVVPVSTVHVHVQVLTVCKFLSK